MLIALDYDHTYTEDPELWNAFVISARARGHGVVCVTMRYDNAAERVEVPLEVIYTGRRSKETVVKEQGLIIDVWIDDSPYHILYDAR